MPDQTSLVVLLSGSGSNLQALIDRCHLDPQVGISIAAVISNKADAYGLQRAKDSGIATAVIDHKDFESRELFDQALQFKIEEFSPDLVILAGFMRILTPGFTEHFEGRMLNIHPSLLPKYQGLHTHQRALDAGDDYHGATVHFVTAELDGGPTIIQAKVPVHASDDESSLARRVLEKEHLIYPTAAIWFASGRLSMSGQAALLDGEPLPEQGHTFIDSDCPWSNSQ